MIPRFDQLLMPLLNMLGVDTKGIKKLQEKRKNAKLAAAKK